MGVIEGDKALGDNDWEKLKDEGGRKVENWIDKQMIGKSVVVVLIGARTAGREFIDYEIEKGWENRMGVFGVHVHNILDRDLNQSQKGRNPFVNSGLSSVVKTYDPPFSTSKYVYNYIRENLSDWADESVEIRKQYR
jgi:hypothetical protein